MHNENAEDIAARRTTRQILQKICFHLGLGFRGQLGFKLLNDFMALKIQMTEGFKQRLKLLAMRFRMRIFPKCDKNPTWAISRVNNYGVNVSKQSFKLQGIPETRLVQHLEYFRAGQMAVGFVADLGRGHCSTMGVG